MRSDWRHRPRKRWALVAVVLVAALGGTTVWKLRGPEPAASSTTAPPATLPLAGETFRYDGASYIAELRQDSADPRLLHAEVLDVLSGIPSRCERRTVVRVVSEDREEVVLEASEYRRRDRGAEELCPFPKAEATLRTLVLREPLGNRDVVERPSAPPLFVQARAVPGRTVVKGTPSCAATSATRPNSGDYANFIRHQGRSYVNRGLAPTPGTVFGARLGTIRCRLAESFTPSMKYQGTDGDAGYLDKGTPYHSVKGQPVQRAIGAVYNGERLVFTYDPSLS